MNWRALNYALIILGLTVIILMAIVIFGFS
jgi:hypothetical protein